MADVLSRYKLIASFGSKPKSDNTLFTYNSSHIPSAIPLNSTSPLDLATTNFFLLLQVTRFPPTKVKYPEVDLLSSAEPAQSTSVYPCVRIIFGYASGL